MPCPPPGDLPDPGIEPESPVSPTLAGGFFTTEPAWKLYFPLDLVYFSLSAVIPRIITCFVVVMA